MNCENEDNYKPFPEFEIVGATDEECHELMMTLCYLPRPHRQVVQKLIIVSLAEWESYLDDLKKLAGYAGCRSHAVVLIREKCKDRLVYNALHEIAHLVWFYYSKEDERQDFLNMVEYIRGDELMAITLYAEIGGFDEHFAEAYANYVLHSRYLRRKEPEVYRWLKNYVFHGETYLWLEQKLKSSQG